MNEPSQTNSFYLHHDNQQIGPFTIPAIREMVNVGTITSETFCWREGLPDWIQLKDLAEYQLASAATPALPTQKARNNAPSIAGTPADWNKPKEEGNIALGVVGGLIGAVIGAFVWAGIAITANVSIGLIAVGVGWLAGYGTLMFSRQRGDASQIIALSTGFFGLVLGKYLIVCHFIAAISGAGWIASALDFGSIKLFTTHLGEFSSLFDILWYGLAMSAAWKVPAD